jgi:dolichyl-phosphate-mannose--protein O-mannosyl transferase
MILLQQSANFRSESIRKLSGKRERKVSKLILWINLSFLVCWMPYGIICTCYFFGGEGSVEAMFFSIKTNPL